MIHTPFIYYKDRCSKRKDKFDIYYSEEKSFTYDITNNEYIFDTTLQQDPIRQMVFHNQNFQRSWCIQNNIIDRHSGPSSVEIINVDESTVHDTCDKDLDPQTQIFNVHINILNK
jgi:hypothetical protein